MEREIIDFLAHLFRDIESIRRGDDPTQKEMIGERLFNPHEPVRPDDVIICTLPRTVSDLRRLVDRLMGRLALCECGQELFIDHDLGEFGENNFASYVWRKLGETWADIYSRSISLIPEVQASGFSEVCVREGNVVVGVGERSELDAYQHIHVTFPCHERTKDDIN